MFALICLGTHINVCVQEKPAEYFGWHCIEISANLRVQPIVAMTIWNQGVYVEFDPHGKLTRVVKLGNFYYDDKLESIAHVPVPGLPLPVSACDNTKFGRALSQYLLKKTTLCTDFNNIWYRRDGRAIMVPPIKPRLAEKRPVYRVNFYIEKVRALALIWQPSTQTLYLYETSEGILLDKVHEIHSRASFQTRLITIGKGTINPRHEEIVQKFVDKIKSLPSDQPYPEKLFD
jgi:hypothetical protein